MGTIEQRFNNIVYKKDKLGMFNNRREIKSEDVVFFICDELNKTDFKEPFFSEKQVLTLGEGFKFLTYCGKEQNKNINKNALVIQKKLKKDNKIIYKCYLMDKENFNIRQLFLKYAKSPT